MADNKLSRLSSPLREYTEGCRIRHYENCPDCFGFGLYVIAGKTYPVIAAEAGGEEPFRGELVPCKTCGSNERGIACQS